MDYLIGDWEQEFDDFSDWLSPLFGRKEVQHRSHCYLKALLGSVDRKNGWQMAEALGDRSPDGVQRLLNTAQWDPDAVRDALRTYVFTNLSDPTGVLIIDETGFLKKGLKSAGVQRQYTGTAGRIENAQVGVFLCYASRLGAAFVDRELYLPESWTQAPERCTEAGVPADVTFATKPELACRMVLRALEAGVSCGWVVGDEVYGNDRKLRFALEQRHQPFVLAIACKERVMIEGGRYKRADQLAQAIAPEEWQTWSAGEGTKGARWYDWAWTPLYRLQLTAEEKQQGHWLLVRRSLTDPTELAYYVVFAPRETTRLDVLARVAGMRWNIEAGFERAKGECGLDEYEVRRWPGWYRHITLCLLAHAFLTTLRSRQFRDKTQNKDKKGGLKAVQHPVLSHPQSSR